MQIHSLQSTSVAQAVSRASGTQAGGSAGQVAAAHARSADELELSSEAQQISQSQALSSSDRLAGGIRTEKVAALRDAIANGSYETPEKLSAALDRLLDTFA